MKWLGCLLGILLLVVAVDAFSYIYSKSNLTINGYTLQVEEAKTSLQQQRGLSGRKSIAENQGMLFIFPEEKRLSFWMHKMLMPIDMIWLNAQYQVVSIKENVPPCVQNKVCPNYAADGQYVLETQAGFVTKHHVKVGDVVETH